MTSGIHKGDVTHNQLQSILWFNFKVKNKRNKRRPHGILAKKKKAELRLVRIYTISKHYILILLCLGQGEPFFPPIARIWLPHLECIDQCLEEASVMISSLFTVRLVSLADRQVEHPLVRATNGPKVEEALLDTARS